MDIKLAVTNNGEFGYKYFYSYAFSERCPYASPSKFVYAAQLQQGSRVQQ